jgi:hypothetical protein
MLTSELVLIHSKELPHLKKEDKNRENPWREPTIETEPSKYNSKMLPLHKRTRFSVRRR